jgi:hypothetical protein
VRNTWRTSSISNLHHLCLRDLLCWPESSQLAEGRSAHATRVVKTFTLRSSGIWGLYRKLSGNSWPHDIQDVQSIGPRSMAVHRRESSLISPTCWAPASSQHSPGSMFVLRGKELDYFPQSKADITPNQKEATIYHNVHKIYVRV